jgi:uncharacterized protein (UPF0371 family)
MKAVNYNRDVEVFPVLKNYGEDHAGSSSTNRRPTWV